MTYLVENQLLVVSVPGSEALQECLEVGEAALCLLGEVLSQRVQHLLLSLGKLHQLGRHDCLYSRALWTSSQIKRAKWYGTYVTF